MMQQFVVVDFQGKPWLAITNSTQYVKPDLLGLPILIKPIPQE